MKDSYENNIRRPMEIEEADESGQHCSASEEAAFYRAVASGAIDIVQRNCSSGVFENQEGFGRLSDDPVRNLQYHFVVTTALITRFCTDAGMPMEEAYRLSDYYIQHMDRCDNLADIVLLHDQMVLEYTGRMRKRKKYTVSTKQVMEAADYVYVHIRERITVEKLAAAIYVSPSYISRIFKREMGVSLSEYIRLRKLDMAKNLLRFTDDELADIANQLSFSSQSHFIQQFHAQTGMTPKCYRRKYSIKNYAITGNAEDAETEEPQNKE